MGNNKKHPTRRYLVKNPYNYAYLLPTLTKQSLAFEFGNFDYLAYQTVSPKRCWSDGEKRYHSADNSWQCSIMAISWFALEDFQYCRFQIQQLTQLVGLNNKIINLTSTRLNC